MSITILPYRAERRIAALPPPSDNTPAAGAAQAPTRVIGRPSRFTDWTVNAGDTRQAVSAVADVRARIATRLRRIEGQVRVALLRLEDDHEYGAVLAELDSSTAALQAVSRKIGIARRRG